MWQLAVAISWTKIAGDKNDTDLDNPCPETGVHGVAMILGDFFQCFSPAPRCCSTGPSSDSEGNQGVDRNPHILPSNSGMRKTPCCRLQLLHGLQDLQLNNAGQQ
jgi:hypothetical protein